MAGKYKDYTNLIKPIFDKKILSLIESFSSLMSKTITDIQEREILNILVYKICNRFTDIVNFHNSHHTIFGGSTHRVYEALATDEFRNIFQELKYDIDAIIGKCIEYLETIGECEDIANIEINDVINGIINARFDEKKNIPLVNLRIEYIKITLGEYFADDKSIEYAYREIISQEGHIVTLSEATKKYILKEFSKEKLEEAKQKIDKINSFRNECFESILAKAKLEDISVETPSSLTVENSSSEEDSLEEDSLIEDFETMELNFGDANIATNTENTQTEGLIEEVPLAANVTIQPITLHSTVNIAAIELDMHENVPENLILGEGSAFYNVGFGGSI